MMNTETKRFRLGQIVTLETLGAVRIVRIKSDYIGVQAATIPTVDGIEPWLLGYTCLTRSAFSDAFRAAQQGAA